MTADLRINFDIACALGVIRESQNLPFSFPIHVSLEGAPNEILSDCVNPDTLNETSCRIRSEFLSFRYLLTHGRS